MSTPTPDRPPLWRVMHDAFLSSTLSGAEGRLGFAREIRAVRDWLVPDEPEPEPGDRYEQRHIIWRHNQRLRAQLTAEANRAERGDG